MQIRVATLEKMNTLTNREMDFLLYIARFQDKNGRVAGVYWRDLCQNKKEQFTMCKQTFYNALYSLTEKGLISYEQKEKGDYDILILNNEAYDPQEKAPYININRRIFRSKEFIRMKAKEKFMLMDFMYWTAANHGQRSIGVTAFYERYKKKLQVSDRLICQYLHTMKKYFLIVLRKGKYFIQFLTGRFTEPTKGGKSYGGKEQRREYLAKLVLRRCGVKEYSEKTVTDIETLIRQYGTEIREKGFDLLSLFQKCIRQCIVGDTDAHISTAYINKLIQQHIRWQVVE